MSREFTQEESEAHHALTEEGWAIIKSKILLLDSPAAGKPGWLLRRKLRKAIECFKKSLAINPQGWSSMWALGKIYQRLGEHPTALDWFARALEINPTQPNVAREAGLAALDSGKYKLAVYYCSIAAKLSDDPGLVANLALAHMPDGNDTEAVKCARKATSQNPADAISRTVLEVVQAVDGQAS